MGRQRVTGDEQRDERYDGDDTEPRDDRRRLNAGEAPGGRIVHAERREVVVERVCDDGVRPTGRLGACFPDETSAFTRSETRMPGASPLLPTSQLRAAPRGEAGGARSSE